MWLLLMMGKILTAQVREEIYYSFISHRQFPEEQKGCRKGIRKTGELRYYTQHVKCKTRRKNVGKAWIDYEKAYDMVPRSWIIDYLKLYKISGKVMKFIKNIIENCRVELTAGGKSLTEVKIRSGIFLGDALSPLQFVIAMMPVSQEMYRWIQTS